MSEEDKRPGGILIPRDATRRLFASLAVDALHDARLNLDGALRILEALHPLPDQDQEVRGRDDRERVRRAIDEAIRPWAAKDCPESPERRACYLDAFQTIRVRLLGEFASTTEETPPAIPASGETQEGTDSMPEQSNEAIPERPNDAPDLAPKGGEAMPTEQAARIGFHKHSPENEAAIKRVRAKGEELRALLDEIAQLPGHDPRWLSIARTEFQKSCMFAVRSIANPDFF